MAFGDFLKKKELRKIQELETLVSQKETDINSLNETLAQQSDKINTLTERISLLEKYQSIVDIEADIKEKIEQRDKDLTDRQNEIDILCKEIDTLKNNYKIAYQTYLELKKKSDIFRETLDMAEYGVYEPHFNYNTSEEYKLRILRIRNTQKNYINEGLAIVGDDYNISYKRQVQLKNIKKLMLRAFNGECDNFIADVDWNNVVKMQERIEKSYRAINKVYEDEGFRIADKYKELKLDELYLAFEYKDKIHKEKEEQRIIREQMKEEEKAQREIEVALIKAQKNEELYQKALDKTRVEIEYATGDNLIRLQAKITELEARLAETEQNKERALSMAQQTKRGHVYVISNVGSFGDNIYKIGMTRRLDPLDRVRELGDASVPFPFDVHAIIFSEDAPALENTLHKAFDNKRVNMVNPRKEFFNVSLSEIEKVVHENNASIEFTHIAEARDFRETNAIKKVQDKSENTETKFSPELEIA